MTPANPKGFYNKSLERALTILLSFSSENQPMTLTQISTAVDLPKATALRLCATLKDFGFLQYDDQTKLFSLGLKLVELGGIVCRSFSVNEIASPYLTMLQEAVNQTVFMDILKDDQVIHIAKKEDPLANIRYGGVRIGAMRPPHFGSTAQVLMAYLPDKEVDRLMQKYPLSAFTKNSITDDRTFKKRLRKIRKDGFFIESGEFVDGISGIAVPVRDHTGSAVASVAVTYITESIGETEKQRILEETLNASFSISNAMGWSGAHS